MARAALLFLVAIAGGAIGAAMFSSWSEPAGSVRSDRGYDDRELRAEIASLREELRQAPRAGARSGDAGTGVRGAGSGEANADSDEEEPETESETERPADGKQPFVPATYVAALKGRKFDSRTRDRLITSLSLHPDQIDDTIEALLAAVQEEPNSAELQTALASAYTAKTAFGTADGPARGIPFMKALAAYNKALELDPDHWTARYGKAFDTSMAPEFVGMRPAAIRGFEDLMERQELRAPQPEFVQTYVRLGTLYKDAGNAEKARAIWKRGVELFPESKSLHEALSVIDSK